MNGLEIATVLFVALFESLSFTRAMGWEYRCFFSGDPEIRDHRHLPLTSTRTDVYVITPDDVGIKLRGNSCRFVNCLVVLCFLSFTLESTYCRWERVRNKTA